MGNIGLIHLFLEPNTKLYGHLRKNAGDKYLTLTVNTEPELYYSPAIIFFGCSKETIGSLISSLQEGLDKLKNQTETNDEG